MKHSRMLGALLVVLLVCASMAAQTYEGRISGTVTDQTGAVVVGAKVAVTNTDTSATRELVTNQSGDWVAPNLVPGPYKITVQAQNFKRIERTGMRLEVATDIHLDINLQPGAASEVVTVTGEAPLVETTNDTLGGAFANRAINDLPLNGRDYQNLVVLRPGVQRGPGGGFLSISSNGNRPEDNNFIVDGTDNNDPYYGSQVINTEGVQGTPGTILPIDAIQEFNAVENPPAEYGWKPGAIINVGLKSGTNQLHGTGSYFHRNSAFDARNVFNTAPSPQTPLRQHQFGSSIGGPIIKNKTFFFGAYEGVRAIVSNSNLLTVPATVGLPTAGNCTAPGAAGDCANSIPDALGDLTALGIPLNPLSANLLGMGAFAGNGAFPGLFPVNTGINPAGPTQINHGFPNRNRMDAFIVKADHRFSEQHNVTGRYFLGDSTQTEQDVPVTRPVWESTSQLRAQVVGVNWTWAPNERWVNEAKFGYNRFWQSILTADANSDPLTTYGINSGVTMPINFGMPTIQISGFSGAGTAAGLLGGNRGWPLQTIPNQTFQWADNISWTHNRHTIRFGGEFRHGTTHNIRDRFGKGLVKFAGQRTFSIANGDPGDSTALEDFLAGNPDSGQIFVGNSERFVSMNSFGAFVQDDFRMTPRFTVNLGVRYDLNTVIKEAHNLLGNFDPEVGLQQVGLNIGAPYNGDHNNFAPRVGFAWDLRGNGQTVIRGGGGIIYEIPHIAAFIGQNGVNNASTTGINAIPTGAIGTNLVGSGGSIVAASPSVDGSLLTWSAAGPVFNVVADCTPPSPCNILGVTRSLRTPYVTTWNLNLQQALGKSTSLQVAYVGDRGTKLYGVRDINQVDPQSAAENQPGNVFNGNGVLIGCDHCEQAGRPFNLQYPFLGYINFLENGYSSTYHGLQVTLTQRNWHGLSFVAGYTWAHAIDDASLNRAPQPQDSTHPNLERGNSDLDIRNRFTLSMTYDLPGRPGYAQLLEGWQINSIVVLQGGTPWTMFDFGNDPSLTGEFSDRWDIHGDPHSVQGWSVGAPFACTDATGASAVNVDGVCTAYLNGLLTLPALGTFGTAPRNAFRGPSFSNWDFSVNKTFKFNERFNVQFRAESFNVLNHPHFGIPGSLFVNAFNNDLSSPGGFGEVPGTPDVVAANPVIGTGGSRNIQLGLKLRF